MRIMNRFFPGSVPVRERPFFAVAAQGRNSGRSYLKSAAVLLAAFLIIFGGMAAILAWMLASGLIPATTSALLPVAIILMLLSEVLLLPCAIVLMRRIHRRPAITLITPTGELCWFRLMLGFVAWGCILTLSLVANSVLLGISYHPSLGIPFFAYLLAVVLLVPAQAAFEEMVFRGYLTQALVLRTGRLGLSVVGLSTLFGVLHFNPFGSALIMLSVGVYGLGWSVSSMRDGRTELAIGAHAAHNILAFTIFGMRFFPSNPSPAAPETEAALAATHAVGISTILWEFVLVVVFIALTEAVLRWRGA